MRCARKNVALAQWVYATMDFSPVDDTSAEAEALFLASLLPAAIKSGAVDMVEWVWATFRHVSPVVAASASVVDAWEAGTVVMLEWVREHIMGSFALTPRQWAASVRHFAFKNKPDDVVMYLLQHALRIDDSVEDNVEARWCLRVAVGTDRVELVQAMFVWAPSLFLNGVDLQLLVWAHNHGSMGVLLWLLAAFPDLPKHVPPKPCAVFNLLYLQWMHSRIPGGWSKENLLIALRSAAQRNMLDVVQWVCSLGILHPVDVSEHAIVSPRNMQVTTFQAVWVLCGDELYRPVFASQRDEFVRCQAAVGDGVSLTYAFSALDTPPAQVIKSQCKPDTIWKHCGAENELCLNWLTDHDGVGPEPEGWIDWGEVEWDPPLVESDFGEVEEEEEEVLDK